MVGVCTMQGVQTYSRWEALMLAVPLEADVDVLYPRLC
jgi:hypothetical protein